MTEHHDHRDDCPFKFATLDVCDCVEKNMLDRIEALTEARDTMGHLWAKEAAAKQVALCRIETLTAKLAKAVRLLRATRSRLNRSPFDLFLELDAFLAEQGENP